MYLVKVASLLIGGAFVAEGIGYLWHRWACHAGVFRPFFKDLLRRRHFDHHLFKYAGAGIRHDTYSKSCEIAFPVLGIALIALIIALSAIGWLQLDTMAILLFGFFACAALGSKVHALYHLSDRASRRLPILRWGPAWRTFSWLREFHDVHHVANANYSLLLPLFDWIGGTYISPKELPQLHAEDLFPRFDLKLSSSCGERLF